VLLVSFQLIPTRQRQPAVAQTGDAFEDVLYGSESELEDSDDDITGGDAPAKRKKGSQTRLRLDGDEPVDLLGGVASKVTSKFCSHVQP
jgi:ribosomal RNA-processing protein 12